MFVLLNREMGSGFCRKKKNNQPPLSFESWCSFISLPSVHFSVEISILWAHYIPHLLSPPGSSKLLPLALQFDLGPPYLTPAVDPGKSPKWAALGQRKKDENLPFLTPILLRHMAAAIRGHHWARGFTLPKIIIFWGKIVQNWRPKYFCFLHQFVRAQQYNFRLWQRSRNLRRAGRYRGDQGSGKQWKTSLSAA